MLNKATILLIKFYRNYLSMLKLRSCRFYPTCSEYAQTAMEKYGFIKGGVKSIKRILKCHPFHPGGFDPVD